MTWKDLFNQVKSKLDEEVEFVFEREGGNQTATVKEVDDELTVYIKTTCPWTMEVQCRKCDISLFRENNEKLKCPKCGGKMVPWNF